MSAPGSRSGSPISSNPNEQGVQEKTDQPSRTASASAANDSESLTQKVSVSEQGSGNDNEAPAATAQEVVKDRSDVTAEQSLGDTVQRTEGEAGESEEKTGTTEGVGGKGKTEGETGDTVEGTSGKTEETEGNTRQTVTDTVEWIGTKTEETGNAVEGTSGKTEETEGNTESQTAKDTVEGIGTKTEETGNTGDTVEVTSGKTEEEAEGSTGRQTAKDTVEGIGAKTEETGNTESRTAKDTVKEIDAKTKETGGTVEETAKETSKSNDESTEENSISKRKKSLSITTNFEQSSSDTPPRPSERDPSHINPQNSSLAASTSGLAEKDLPTVPSSHGKNDDHADDSQSEIQSIMEQFEDPTRNNAQDEIMSPRLQLAGQFLGGANQFPPRHSSLEHLPSKTTTASPSVDAQPGTPNNETHNKERPSLSRRTSSSTVPPPPPPAPEPDQPFDFHRFLEQLRHRTADPVARFLRSFLTEFGRRQWMVHEQVKIIGDFLTFITNRMAQCEVWRNVSDSEFENAKEGMEKLVMNRLYSQTFSPSIPSPPVVPRSASRSRRREIERRHGPWRRGQHQEDIERDEVLDQKARIYSWVRERHMDIPPLSPPGRRFLALAQQGKDEYANANLQGIVLICLAQNF